MKYACITEGHPVKVVECDFSEDDLGREVVASDYVALILPREKFDGVRNFEVFFRDEAGETGKATVSVCWAPDYEADCDEDASLPADVDAALKAALP